MTWWRDVRVGRAGRVSLVALYGALLGGALCAAGCTTVSNPRSCADGFCHDPALPFCDVDGTIAGGQRLTCIAVACTPLEFAACRGDEAIVCNAAGDDYDVTHCQGGCDAAAGGCAATHIIPRYLPTVCDQLATEPELAVSESMTLDTNIDANCNGGVVDQANGPDICVLRYGTITVDRNKTLTVTGDRALALVADHALTIDGILDVSANGTTNGPGGRVITSTSTNALAPAGCGGIGFRTKGGNGGDATDGGAFNGGAESIDPALLVELVGGPGEPLPFLQGPPAGAGGGASAISCRGTVFVLGMIDAGGGGGPGGTTELFNSFITVSAGGGGAGGYIVFQGMMVIVTGQLFANGGGGGAGRNPFGATGNAGADGLRSDVAPAPGGTSVSGEGAGGTGGIGNVAPGSGKTYTAGNAGAGGGSTGFFQTYTPVGVTPMLSPAAASPPLQTNRTVDTR